MDSKKHFKLYKSGKKWCAMAIATTAAVIGMTAATQSVQADVTDASDSVQQVNNNNQDVVTTNNNQNNESNTQNNTNVADSSLTSQTLSVSNVNSTKNGWYDENGQKVYYQNGQTESGRHYSQLKSMDGSDTQNYYLIDNGVAQSGLQEWQGTNWYFDPDTYQLVKNEYVDPDNNNTGFLTNNDGAVLSGLQKWQGNYFYFNQSTYQLEKNNYVDPDGNNSGYLLGSDGIVKSGLQEWQGNHFYFDEGSKRLQKNTYVVPAGMSNGYLLDQSGIALTGVQKWQGTYYYFDPSNYQLVKNAYVQSQWGSWYLFGDNGMIVTGLANWQGSLFYFDPNTYQVDKNMDVVVNGVIYHLDNNGFATVVNNAASKADRALTMLGTPYVWGGNTPSGFDCSGLVQWAFGLSSNYRTTYQQTNLGAHHYDVYNAPKGSLVFFGSDSAPYHVGISLGNGSFVHAPEPGDVVKTTKMAYYTPSYYIVMN